MQLFSARISRRQFVRATPALIGVGLMTMACQSAAPAAPAATSVPAAAKPTEAPKPAESKPAETKPAAPAAAPAATQPAATAAAKPAAQAAPAAGAAADFDKVDVDAAKKEGTVVWYTSNAIGTAQLLAGAFEKQHGFKVDLLRTGGEQVLQRFQQELSAKKLVVDVVGASDAAAFNGLAAKGLFEKFRPENYTKVPDSARHPDSFWIAQRLNLLVNAFRTDKEAEVEMPKSWADITDPKYKGKLVHTDPSFTANGLQIVATLTKQFGWEYYEKLHDLNMLIVQGSQQVSQIMSTAERTIALGAGDGDLATLRKAGTQVKNLYPSEGVFVIPSPQAIVKDAPHPNAARLLTQFLMSEPAQKILVQEGGVSSRTDIAPPEGLPPLDSIKLMAIDFDYVDKNAAQVKQRFGEIFSN